MRILGSAVLCRLFLFVLVAAVCYGGTLPEPAKEVPAGRIYDAKQSEVAPPRIRKKVKAEYSAEARSAGAQGTCLLEVVVDGEGVPTNISVMSPIGFGLEDKAIQAVSQWRFRPAKKDGVPVAARTTVEVMFRLPQLYFDSKTEAVRTKYNVMLKDIIHQGRTLTPAQESAMRAFAKQGFSAAKTVVGLWNLSEDNVHRNEAEGVQFIQEAAQQEQPSALYVLGQLRTRGGLLPKDQAGGLEVIQQAAMLGHATAQWELGLRYASGAGVPRDVQRANRYFRQCARSGDANCQYEIGRSLQEQGSSSDADHLQALAWLQLAAEKDHADAKRRLAEHPVTLTAEQNKQLEALKDYLPQSDFH